MAASSTRPRNVVAETRSGRRPAREGARSGGRAGGWGETLRAFGGTVVLFLLIRAFLIEAFRIPSGSMIPSLLVGDWLFVNKLVYGPHVPFTDVNLPGYADPQRQEVVVFRSPYQADEAARGADPTPTLVKRLVGLPGDTVWMRGDTLWVNGILQRPVRGAEANPVGDATYQDPAFTWQSQYAVPRAGVRAVRATSLGNWGPLLVPPGHYFMLGDNRYNSKDSRYWGLVPRANLRGRPIFVYYSYNAEDSPDALPFLTDVRWGRIGHMIR